MVRALVAISGSPVSFSLVSARRRVARLSRSRLTIAGTSSRRAATSSQRTTPKPRPSRQLRSGRVRREAAKSLPIETRGEFSRIRKGDAV